MAIYRCGGRKRAWVLCDYEAPERWVGPCPGCGQLYKIEKLGSESTEPNARRSVATLALKPIAWITTGFPQLDKTLGGGGLVPGSTLFLGGEPGGGKTTLALQIANNIALQPGKRVLFASAEQNTEDIGRLAQRLRCLAERLEVVSEGDVYKITDDAKAIGATLLVVDSLQTISLDDVNASEGTGAQVSASTDYITAFGKRENMTIIIVCQINKDGELAGTKKAEHACDTVTYLDSMLEFDEDGETVEESKDLRQLVVGKNRNGESGLSTLFKLTETGMHPVRKKSKLVSV